jgi:molecular chaperone GrpE
MDASMRDSTADESGTAPPIGEQEEIGSASPDGADEFGGGGNEAETDVAALRREVDAHQDRYLRLAAEFDNFRRRSIAQMGESEVRAQARLIGTLLEALDDMGRVTALDPEAATVDSVLEGVGLVERKLRQLLQEAGLEEVNPEGEPFDPNIMEAITRVPAETQEDDDTVDQVFQRGFRFRGHLVRPARVSVRMLE